jgi:hypothetical protein
MPFNAQHSRCNATPLPFVVDIAGKGRDAVERMIDKINGDMFLDFSHSSFHFDDVDLRNVEDEVFSTDSDEPSKRVSFPDDEVSHVWERPFTTAEEKQLLFYSGKDISKFRLEYRAIVRAHRDAQIKAQLELPSPPSSSAPLPGVSSYKQPMHLSGFSSILHKATQIANAVSQSGKFFAKYSNQEDASDAMLVVDTLYLF